MRLENLQLYIEKDFMKNEVKLWITRDTHRVREHYTYIDGVIQVTESEAGCLRNPENTKPFIVLNHDFFEVFIALIADYANKSDIKTEAKEFVNGKLEATESQVNNLMLLLSKMIDKNNVSETTKG